jgi:hypothetical protein
MSSELDGVGNQSAYPLPISVGLSRITLLWSIKTTKCAAGSIVEIRT